MLIHTQTAHCIHCDSGLSIGQKDFCCEGCRSVYHIIQARGLGSYYDLRLERGVKADKLDHDFNYMVEEKFKDEFLNLDGCFYFYLEGIHCTSCIWLIESILKEIGAIEEFKISLEHSTVKLKLKDYKLLAFIAKELTSIGY